MIDLDRQAALLRARPRTTPGLAGMTDEMVAAGVSAIAATLDHAAAPEDVVIACYAAMDAARPARPGVKACPGSNEIWAG